MRFHVGQRVPSLVALLAVFCLAIVFSLRYAPPAKIHTDSGGFLYGGWQLLQGKLPYVDFWDHKPPAVFLFNAIGLSLGAGYWGVWAFETLLFASSLTFFSAAVKKRFGVFASAIAAIVLVFGARNRFFLMSGNFTESYAVCFSMFILAGLLWQSRHVAVWFMMGMAGATIFFTKQSCIAVPFAVGVTLGWMALAKNSGEARRACVAYFSGALTLLTIGILLMAAFGILPEFWDTNFVFNRVYVVERNVRLSRGILRRICLELYMYDPTGVLHLSFFVLMATSLRLLLRRTLASPPKTLGLEPTILLALVLEFFFASLPFRFHPHYFIGTFPLIALGVAIWYDTVRRLVAKLPLPETAKYIRVTVVTCMACLAIPAFSGPLSIWTTPDFIRDALLHRYATHDPELFNYLATKNASSPLLMWGSGVCWNFIAQRPSPSRYSFLAPLVHPGYGQADRFQEFLRDLKAHPDTIIVDTMTGTINALEKKDTLVEDEEQDLCRPIPTDLMEQLRAYVSKEYRVDVVFSKMAWYDRWVAYVPRKMGK